jgi:Glycosyltransferase family 87
MRTIASRFAAALLLACPFLAYGAVLVLTARTGGLGFDFHVFWDAARAVTHGRSPYDPDGIAHVAEVAKRGGPVPTDNAWAVYPPLVYAAIVPIGFLPWPVAAVLGMSLLAVTPALALRVMGVRDWRCYSLLYLSPPVFTSIFLGALSTALMLGFALIWAGRSTVASAAATIAAKLFLWPLAIAVAGLRGIRRAALALAIAAGCALASWAVIGFADLDRYPAMLSDLSTAEAHTSFSTTGLAYALGLPAALGGYAGIVAGISVAAMAYRAGRGGRTEVSFTLALVAAFLLSPIVWMHYLTLAFVPLAARFPRANAAWVLPLVIWADSPQAPNGDAKTFIWVWAFVAVVVVATLRRGRGGGVRRLPAGALRGQRVG